MRIISQNGIFDLPYESSIVWIHNKTEIEAYPLGEPDSNYTFAYYSTQGKQKRLCIFFMKRTAICRLSFKILKFQMKKFQKSKVC